MSTKYKYTFKLCQYTFSTVAYIYEYFNVWRSSQKKKKKNNEEKNLTKQKVWLLVTKWVTFFDVFYVCFSRVGISYCCNFSTVSYSADALLCITVYSLYLLTVLKALSVQPIILFFIFLLTCCDIYSLTCNKADAWVCICGLIMSRRRHFSTNLVECITMVIQ